MTNVWPNNPVEFAELYQDHKREYEVLKHKPAWARSAAEDDHMRQLWQKLVQMEKRPWAHGSFAVA